MTTSTPHDAEASPEASAEDAAELEGMLRMLAESTALLPQAPQEQDDTEMPEGAIALPVIEQDGTQFIPVFTSEEALEAAGADAGSAVRIPLAELAANWPAEDMWLAVNPSSPDGLALPPDLVRSLPVFAGMAAHDAAGAAGDVGEDRGGQEPGSG
jgi:hypothetical protein